MDWLFIWKGKPLFFCAETAFFRFLHGKLAKHFLTRTMLGRMRFDTLAALFECKVHFSINWQVCKIYLLLTMRAWIIILPVKYETTPTHYHFTSPNTYLVEVNMTPHFTTWNEIPTHDEKLYIPVFPGRGPTYENPSRCDFHGFAMITISKSLIFCVKYTTAPQNSNV